MKPQPMSDAEIDAMDKFALHVTAPGRRNGVRSYAAAIIAARDAQWAAMIGEPVAGRCKFVHDVAWQPCSAAHVQMVQNAPHEWPDYEVSPLYAIKETP